MRILLRDENIRDIARYCKEPHTSEEIIKHILSLRDSKNRELYETIVADDLKRMENTGLITFEHGKWKTREIALRVLEKYYGG